jgi:hypothetical protein
MTTITRHFNDLFFTVVATVNEYDVAFVGYQIEGLVLPEETPEWHKKGGATWPDGTDNLDDAEVYFHGFVKWDGCSNWHIDEQDRVMLHGCSREDLTNLGEVLARCWDMTAELLPNWDGAN